jgi:6-phosphogluconolactonase
MRVYGLAAVMALIPAVIGCGHSSHFIYTVGPSTNAVIGFQERPNGELTELDSATATDAGPVAMAVDPSAQFAYVANFDAGFLSVFAFNPQKGTLTAATDPNTGLLVGPIFCGPNPIALTITANGSLIYVLNQIANPVPNRPGQVQATITAFGIFGPTGALTAVTGQPFNTPTGTSTLPVAIASTPDSKFVYIADAAQANISGFAIGPNSALTPMPNSFTAGPAPTFITIDPSSRFLYVADKQSNQVFGFAINAGTGALSPLNGSPFAAGTTPVSLAIDSTGVLLVAANKGSNNISAYSIDNTTGGLTPLQGSPFKTGTAPASVTFDGTNRFVYVADSVSNDVAGFAITNGTLKSIFQSPFNVDESPTFIVAH